MELNKIRRLQYTRIKEDPVNENTLVNTVLVSEVNSFDYADNVPYELLFLPFRTLLRARDYLLANNKTHTIKVLPGNYIIPPGTNMDYPGIWSFEDGTFVEVQIGFRDREYLFTGNIPTKVVGKAEFNFFWDNAGLYYPTDKFTKRTEIEAKRIISRESLMGIGNYGYLGGWGVFKNISFECTNFTNGRNVNLFYESDLKGQVFHFEGCGFNSYYLEMENYSTVEFRRCATYGFIGVPAVTIGAGATTDPKFYAVNFIDCDFDLHSNNYGGILLKSTGVRLCVSRCRFVRGDNERFAIKTLFENVVAINGIGTSPIVADGVTLTNVCGNNAYQYIEGNLLPYLLTV